MQIRAAASNEGKKGDPRLTAALLPTTSMANCKVFSHAFIIQEQPPKNKVCTNCPANQADWICVYNLNRTPFNASEQFYVWTSSSDNFLFFSF